MKIHGCEVEFSEEDDGRVIADVPEFPGVLVYGKDRDEALERVKRLFAKVLLDAAQRKALANPQNRELSHEARVALVVGLESARTRSHEYHGSLTEDVDDCEVIRARCGEPTTPWEEIERRLGLDVAKEDIKRSLGLIPDVIRAEVSSPPHSYIHALAFVARHTMDVGMRVYEVEEELSKKYPEAQIDIHVRVGSESQRR